MRRTTKLPVACHVPKACLRTKLRQCVLKVEEFLAGPQAAPGGTVQASDTVRGSDHLEIGKVKRVEQGSEVVGGYMLVGRGLILEKNTYIPLDSVERPHQ